MSAVTDPVGDTGPSPTPQRRRRWWLLVPAGLALLLVAYYLVCLVQVRRAARGDDAEPADAIVVLGAAQYDGRPSPQLATRLDHALELWEAGLAPTIVVTGGRQPTDRFTEATASANYLIQRGVPDSAILREVQGATTWESLAASARILRNRGMDSAILVTDPYHALRAQETAHELGLDVHSSPTPYSLVRGGAEWRRMLQEAAGVAVGRVIGYRRLLRLTG